MVPESQGIHEYTLNVQPVVFPLPKKRCCQLLWYVPQAAGAFGQHDRSLVLWLDYGWPGRRGKGVMYRSVQQGLLGVLLREAMLSARPRNGLKCQLHFVFELRRRGGLVHLPLPCRRFQSPSLVVHGMAGFLRGSRAQRLGGGGDGGGGIDTDGDQDHNL